MFFGLKTFQMECPTKTLLEASTCVFCKNILELLPNQICHLVEGTGEFTQDSDEPFPLLNLVPCAKGYENYSVVTVLTLFSRLFFLMQSELLIR
tara:strand:+ start:1153 stop:1434 length:282 start_codon:yes stop_codon:yes gene_type:complete